jgi:hypothetical protein
MGKKGLGLLLAGLAAYGYYRFTKMSDEDKTKLKEKGRKFVDENLGGLSDLFGKKSQDGQKVYNGQHS